MRSASPDEINRHGARRKVRRCAGGRRRTADPVAAEVLPAGLRALRSVLAGRRPDRPAVDAGALGECADGRIRAKLWYIPIVVLLAGVNVAVYGLMRWLDMPLPAS